MQTPSIPVHKLFSSLSVQGGVRSVVLPVDVVACLLSYLLHLQLYCHDRTVKLARRTGTSGECDTLLSERDWDCLLASGVLTRHSQDAVNT